MARVAGAVFPCWRGDSTDIAERKQLVAECNKLAETTRTLSIYFTDTARRLELCVDADRSGLAENIQMIRELLTVLRCGVGEIERATAGCDAVPAAPSQSDAVTTTPSQSDAVTTTPSQSDAVTTEPSQGAGAAHIYTVGVMSHTARIQAPNPEAAVVFYGTLMYGNALFAAVVYEVDGETYTGNSAPMLDVQLGQRELSDEELATIQKDLKDCSVVEWGGALVEAP